MKLIGALALAVALLLSGSPGHSGSAALDETPNRIDHAVRIPVAAEELVPGLHRISGLSHVFVINGSEASLLVDTGQFPQSREQKILAEKTLRQPLKYIVLTHSHVDHTGSIERWLTDHPQAQVITAEEFERYQWLQRRLEKFYSRRGAVLYPTLAKADGEQHPEFYFGQVEPDVLVREGEPLRLDLGGRPVEIIAAPGAEGNDGLVVWLPEAAALLPGDLFGPLFPMWPNLYTIRGESYRDPYRYLQSLERVLTLQPRVLIPSHFEHHDDAEFVQAGIRRIHDAVAYVLDETLRLMNEGHDVYHIMRTVQLPPSLQLSEGHGKLSWSVRAIWEQYTGWFRYASTTELYAVPPDAMYGELAELIDSGDLRSAIDRHLAAGEWEKSLHLIEIAQAARHPAGQLVDRQRRALEGLLARAVAEGNSYSEVVWLQAQLRQLPPPAD